MLSSIRVGEKLMTPEQYKELLEWRDTVDDRLNKLDGGHVRMSDKLEFNTAVTLRVEETLASLVTNLGDLPAFLAEGRVSLKFFSRLISIARWLLYYLVLPTASALAAIYFYKHGFFPTWFETLVEFIRDLGGLS